MCDCVIVLSEDSGSEDLSQVKNQVEEKCVLSQGQSGFETRQSVFRDEAKCVSRRGKVCVCLKTKQSVS